MPRRRFTVQVMKSVLSMDWASKGTTVYSGGFFLSPAGRIPSASHTRRRHLPDCLKSRIDLKVSGCKLGGCAGTDQRLLFLNRSVSDAGGGRNSNRDERQYPDHVNDSFHHSSSALTSSANLRDSHGCICAVKEATARTARTGSTAAQQPDAAGAQIFAQGSTPAPVGLGTRSNCRVGGVSTGRREELHWRLATDGVRRLTAQAGRNERVAERQMILMSSLSG